MRWVLRAGPVLATAFMLWGLLAWRADCQQGYSCESAPVVAVATAVVIVVLAVLLLVVVAAVRKLLGREGPTLDRRYVILAFWPDPVLRSTCSESWVDVALEA
jgi:hypothetical protein